MRIGVCGAGGRMGREVCKAVEAEEGLELVCAVDPGWQGRLLRELEPGIAGGLVVEARIESLLESGVEVLIDFSLAHAARENVTYALERGIHAVVGTTGLGDDDMREFDRAACESGSGCLVAPNFAIGAVLMMEFARIAARHMESCEIIELHHAGKLDAPSGTARVTARIIAQELGMGVEEEREEGPRGLEIGRAHVHSVRLPGLVAHQEVIFGGRGQTLTIRHDSFDRTSFMPGVLLAATKVGGMRGLVVGLDRLLIP